MKAFANNLKKVRIAKGLTQQKVADSVGVKLQLYQSWEEGRSQPRYEAQKGLIKEFGIKDWRIFCEFDGFDTVKDLQPPQPQNILVALQENYNQADAKTRLAVNILLGLVEVE